MRGFHHIQNVLSVVVMLFIAVIWGVAAAPGYLIVMWIRDRVVGEGCLLYTSPSPRDKRQSRMPSSA